MQKIKEMPVLVYCGKVNIMKNISLTVPLLAFAFLSACFTSCDNKAEVHKSIICYIDFSENPNWDQRVGYYADVVNNSIIKNMSFNDRIVVLPIDNGTTTNSSELIDRSLKKQFAY